MIRVYDRVPKDKRIEMLEFTSNIILRARDYYRDNTENRDVFLAYNSPIGKTRYLAWECNRYEGVVFWVDDLWNYDLNDERIDEELFLRSDIFFFDEAEEYSIAIASVILTRYLDKECFFYDSRIEDFVPASPRLHIIKRFADVYRDYKYVLSRRTMRIESKLEYKPWNPLLKDATSVSIMNTIFWMSNTVSYGSKNPDKAIMLISYSLEKSGLVDMIKYALFDIMAAREKKYMGMEIIPFIDFSLDKNNIVTDKLGVNAWTELFNQVSDLTAEEVYNSKNVILINHKLMHLNIYINECMTGVYWSDMITKYLHLKESIYETINNKMISFFKEGEKVLGVSARGTDYAVDIYPGCDGKYVNPREFIHAVEMFFETHDYDRIFFSTEDETYYKEMKESYLWKYTTAFERERIDFTENNGNPPTIFTKMKTPVTEHIITYLTELYFLSRCDGLMANMKSGGVMFAIGMNNDKYEDRVIYR